jgi:hypothetical protein
MRAHALQYTIRGIPEEVGRALKQRARLRKMSVNQLIVEELTKATIGHTLHADFSDLVGRWAPDEAFDEILESQRQVHAEDWH